MQSGTDSWSPGTAPGRWALIRRKVSDVGSTSGVPRLALTPTQAAEALSVSPDFFRDHVAAELRWTYRGRKKLVAVTELQRWLDASAAKTLS